MLQFKLHNIETAPAESKIILAEAEKQMGMIPNLYAVMAESPQTIKAYSEMGKIFGQTSFSQIEKNIIWITVSYANKCHYCMSIHSMAAKMYQVPDEIVEALRNNQPLNDSKLETLRQFTALMVEKRGWASDEEINKFLNAGYTKAQILELIVGIAQKTISNYVNHIAATPLDESVKPFKWEAPSKKAHCGCN